MLRFDSIVFGPIRSRRLGSSLGINPMPKMGKMCNFDCIYCECGWNKDGKTNYGMPGVEELSSALEEKLLSCRNDGQKIDSITFSGHGEPTLHPLFPEMVDETLRLRDRYYPEAKVSVLSNATSLDREKIVEALKKVDNPILKLDAPTDAAVSLINKPTGHFSVSKVVEGMKKFNGNFILQTMFLHGATFDYAEDPELLSTMIDIICDLHPRKVMVYTLDRPAPQLGLEKMSSDEIFNLLRPLKEAGINLEVYA